MADAPVPGRGARWSRHLTAVGGGLPVASVALPVVVAWTHAVATGRPVRVLLDAAPLRVWTALLAALLLCGVAGAALGRRWAHVAVLGGLLLVAAQPELSHLTGFDGVASVGVGEEEPRWRRREQGPLAATPELGPVEFEEGAAIRIPSLGAEARLPVDASVSEQGMRVTLRVLAHAPVFRIRAPDGKVVEEGLVELREGESGFIEVASLPHRFYFTATGPVTLDPPERIRLRIQRGKLALFDGPLAAKEEAKFDGLSISWDEGSRWAQLEVTASARPWLAWAGLALAVEGLLVGLFLRRRGGA